MSDTQTNFLFRHVVWNVASQWYTYGMSLPIRRLFFLPLPNCYYCSDTWHWPLPSWTFPPSMWRGECRRNKKRSLTLNYVFGYVYIQHIYNNAIHYSISSKHCNLWLEFCGMYWRFHFWEFEFSFLVFKKTVGVAVQWAVFSDPFYASLLHITRIMNTIGVYAVSGWVSTVAIGLAIMEWMNHR